MHLYILPKLSDTKSNFEMEINQHSGFIEELLALRINNWVPINPSFQISEMDDLLPNGRKFDSLQEGTSALFPTSFCQELTSPFDQQFCFNESYNCPFFGEEISIPHFTDSSYNTLDTPPFPLQEDNPMSYVEDEDLRVFSSEVESLEMQATCKAESIQSSQLPVFSIGSCSEKKARGKKLEGQPSKNLMAERRRRKRLNDRLSMLRSIVPKISKMDRTSILGDTIDYIKELIDRINNLQQDIEVGSDHLNTLMGIFKESRANEFVVRNSPKFDVERRNEDTQVEICCQSKPGLLLSTITTLEALGLEIQQCVISCFNDFAVQASCSEELDQRTTLSSEDIKQALFRSAGYGGRCL